MAAEEPALDAETLVATAVAVLLLTAVLAAGPWVGTARAAPPDPDHPAADCGATESKLGPLIGSTRGEFTSKNQNDSWNHTKGSETAKYVIAAQGGAPAMHAGVEVFVYGSNFWWPTPFLDERCERIAYEKVGYVPVLIDAPEWARYVNFYLRPNQDGIEIGGDLGDPPWLWSYEIAMVQGPDHAVF